MSRYHIKGGLPGAKYFDRFLKSWALAILFSTTLLSSPVGAAELDFPKLTGRVVDEANVLSPQSESALEAMLADHEKKSGDQIVVVTLESLRGQAIESYGVSLGRHWQIGQAKKNNGLLFIIAPNDSKARIDVGYGLEGVLTDALSRTILERVVFPDFKAGKMESGIVRGSRAILSVLGYEESGSGAASGAVKYRGRPSLNKKEGSPSIFPLMMMILLISLFSKSTFGKVAGTGGALVLFLLAFLKVISVGILFIFLFILLMAFFNRGGPFVAGGGGFYGGGYGGSGGGFGGFSGGGGSFGGGGASGGW